MRLNFFFKRVKKDLSSYARAERTARLKSEPSAIGGARIASRSLVVAALVVMAVAGFGFRAYHLSADGLSEDELNKVNAVAEYRERGLTSANGEHPFLMKALLSVSIIAADAWNSSSLVESRPDLKISIETAARLPVALLGALSALLIFLIASEIFGVEIGLIAAALWTLDPAAVGFNRIAKEDSFLLFFFLLGNVFWLRGQSAAEAGERRPEPFYWAAAAAFGAMLASKYVPHLFAISASYYYIFQGVRRTRWRLGKRKWLIFFAVMGAAFVVCNPTILLPDTWREMRTFAGEKRIGHDAYEYMGQLYRNQMTLWLNGSPWHFYYVFMAVKLPLATTLGFIVGLPLLFTKRLGAGRYFILFWLFFWFFPFTFLGGKFTRYFTFALPAVLLTAAIGFHFIACTIARLVERFKNSFNLKTYVRATATLLLVSFSAYAVTSAAPHYRLYTNALGGGSEGAGSFFPHDEFYDGSVREIAREVARIAPEGARVANETPELFSFYARLAGRNDLISISLSDVEARSKLTSGDIVVIAHGRRYFSNDRVTQTLLNEHAPASIVSQGEVESARVYLLDDAAAVKMARISAL